MARRGDGIYFEAEEDHMIETQDQTIAIRPSRRRRRQGLGLYQTRTGRWKLDCWIRGQRLRQSFGAIDEKLARELATAARAAALRGQAGILPPVRRDLPFDRALREFRERHVSSKRAATQRTYGQDLAHLEAFFTDKRLSEIGPLTVEGYRRDRTQQHTRAKVRCNREVALLRTLYARMTAWGLYEGDNPVRTLGGKSTVGRYEESRGRERVLTSAEEARLVAELREPYATLVLLGLHTGLRLRSEGLTLVWADVDLERGRLTVQGAHAKNGTPRVIPLSGPLGAALARLRGAAEPTAPVFVTRAGRPLRDLRSVLRRAASRARVPGVSPHVLRHTWASRFMQAGGDLRTLQALGGWKRIEMVTRYAHSDEIHAAAALARMVAAFPVPAEVPAAGQGSAVTIREVSPIRASARVS
jgi:integrase